MNEKRGETREGPMDGPVAQKETPESVEARGRKVDAVELSKLWKFIVDNFPGEHGRGGGNETAVEIAIRLIEGKRGRLADKLEVQRLLKKRVEKAFESFLKGNLHEYTADVIRVNENERNNRSPESPAILILDRNLGGFVRIDASEKFRKKLLSIATPSKYGGSWAILEDASERE